MKITVITPLFPPDVSKAAVYAKELCVELTKKGHTVTCIHYGKYPENVDGVEFITVNKNTSSSARMFLLLKSIVRFMSRTDKFILLNGPSTELPTIMSMVWFFKSVLYIENDRDARNNKNIFKVLIYRICKIVTKEQYRVPDEVLEKPWIHPLTDEIVGDLSQYNKKWLEHLSLLQL